MSELDNTVRDILAYYNKQLNDRHLNTSKAIEYESSANLINSCANDIKERLKIKLRGNGYCSSVLIEQLTRHKAQLGEVFSNGKNPNDFSFLQYYNSSEILETIELIELDKKNGEQFKHLPLQNLYKIHHSTYSGIGYSVIYNIKNYWFNNDGEIITKRKKEFDSILKEYGKEKISVILNRMHDIAMFNKKLTGEWLIYAINNDVKYYLCLAMHEEGDVNIFENKIKKCFIEFPELII